MFRKIRDHHRAWTTEKPTAWDIQSLLRDHPNTTIITVSRLGAATINKLAMKVLFKDRHKKCIGTAELDWESNADNYDRNGKLKDQKPETTSTRIYKVAPLLWFLINHFAMQKYKRNK